MVYDYFDKFTFLCEVYNEEADRIEELILHYFPSDGSIQVINVRKSKIQLSRVQMPSITLNQLQLGNIINIFGKLLFIKDCTPNTREELFSNLESTFALIKPMEPSIHGKVITYIVNHGFRILQMKNGVVSKEFVKEMYKNVHNKQIPLVVNYIASGEVIGLELEAPSAVSKWRSCLGETNPAEAAPGTLRKIFGVSYLYNVAHGSSTKEEAKEMIEMFFGTVRGHLRVSFRATFKDCTCCIIKPHAVLDGNVGKILEDINSDGKFVVTALAMFSVKYVDAMEFYEIYKGVLSEYEKMATQLTQGKCIALEVKLKNPGSGNVVEEFRKLCGPRNPIVCRQLYPESLRAKYGLDSICNAVHCTDLPEDGELEVEYFFRLLGGGN